MADDPFSAFLSALANGATGSAGQAKPMDIQSTFASLFNDGDNAPKKPTVPTPEPLTDAAGMAQGFQGITQGHEGLNTLQRPADAEPDPFWQLFAVYE